MTFYLIYNNWHLSNAICFWWLKEKCVSEQCIYLLYSLLSCGYKRKASNRSQFPCGGQYHQDKVKVGEEESGSESSKDIKEQQLSTHRLVLSVSLSYWSVWAGVIYRPFLSRVITLGQSIYLNVRTPFVLIRKPAETQQHIDCICYIAPESVFMMLH